MPNLNPPLPAWIEAIQPSLDQFVTAAIRQPIQHEKRWQEAMLRRNHYYYTGQQNLVLTTTSGIPDYRPVSTSDSSLISNRPFDQLYDYVLNVFAGDIDKFVAVLGSRSPNATATAKDTDSEDQTRAARKALRALAYFRNHWNIDALHRHLCLSLAKNGTTASFVRYTTNRHRYGQTPVPRMEERMVPVGEPTFQCIQCGATTPQGVAQSLDPAAGPVCQQCGAQQPPEALVPPEMIPQVVPVGVQLYDNGAVELDLCTPDSFTMPFWVKDPDCAPWLLYEYEADCGELMQQYPQIREWRNFDVDSGPQTDYMARFTRDVFSSPVGQVWNIRRNRWTYSRIWLASSQYELISGDPSGRMRDQLYSLAPEGCRLTYIAGQLVAIDPDNKRRSWAFCKPKPSESIFAPPYFDAYVQGQDLINDAINMVAEAMERSAPTTAINADVIDPDAMAEWSRSPGEFLPVHIPQGEEMGKIFFKFQAAEIDAALYNFIDWYIGKLREVSGIQPAIFGAGGPEQTAWATKIKTNQALAQLNIPWGEIRQFWARTYENGLYQAARFSSGRLYSSRGSLDTVSFTEIEGVDSLVGADLSIQVEETMPMTAGQRRDQAMEFLNMPPQSVGAMVLGVSKPANLKRALEAVGEAGWEIPGLAARDKVMDVITQLMQGQPIEAPPPMLDPMTGMMPPPMPPQPSIPPDPELLDPTMAVDVVRDYLLGDKVAGKEGTPGYANVRAYLSAWLMILNPPLPPPGPNGPGGPSAPGNETQSKEAGEPSGLAAPPPGAPPDMGAAPSPPPVALAGPG